MEELNEKLNRYFAGKVVRKDLTKKIKEGANVPVYVLEYLLGMYCATDDEKAIEDGVETVKKILADNFVRPDEAEKVKSKIRENGSYTVIDKITVKLNDKMDRYEAEFSNLGIKDASINEKFVNDYEKLLVGGIWCIVSVSYYHDDQDRHALPFTIIQLTPIQMPNLDLQDLKQGRSNFTKEEWMDVLIRSMGIEPSKLKRLYLTAKDASTNFKDIPNIAPIKIQNAAPGPPKEIAIATPAIEPNPVVPERAVAKA